MADANQILNLPMQANDAEASTVKDYLKALLIELWAQGERFSGKRPFGNSGWDYDLFKPLVVAGLVAGKFDEDGYIEVLDEDSAEKLIEEAIDAL